MNRYLSLLAIPALIACSATAAHAFPVGEKPHLVVEDGRCIVFIDPPLQIPVTFSGTIGGTAFSEVGFYAAEEPHKAKVDVTDLFPVGAQHVVVTATAPFLGTSPTTVEDFTCKPEPETTTSSTTSSTISDSSTSSSSMPSHESTTSPTRSSTASTTVAGVTATPSTQIGKAITARRELLPMTGSSSGPLAFAGAALVGLGLALKGRRTR